MVEERPRSLKKEDVMFCLYLVFGPREEIIINNGGGYGGYGGYGNNMMIGNTGITLIY